MTSDEAGRDGKVAGWLGTGWVGAASARVSTFWAGARDTEPVTSAGEDIGWALREFDENSPFLKRAESEQPAAVNAAMATIARREACRGQWRAQDGTELGILVTHTHATKREFE